jgi:hypothetical protein
LFGGRATSGAGRFRILIETSTGSAGPDRYGSPTQERPRSRPPAATRKLLLFALVAAQDNVRQIWSIGLDGLNLTLAILDGVNLTRSNFFVAATIDNPALTGLIRHDLVACPDLSQDLYRHIPKSRIDGYIGSLRNDKGVSSKSW